MCTWVLTQLHWPSWGSDRIMPKDQVWGLVSRIWKELFLENPYLHPGEVFLFISLIPKTPPFSVYLNLNPIWSTHDQATPWALLFPVTTAPPEAQFQVPSSDYHIFFPGESLPPAITQPHKLNFPLSLTHMRSYFPWPLSAKSIALLCLLLSQMSRLCSKDSQSLPSPQILPRCWTQDSGPARHPSLYLPQLLVLHLNHPSLDIIFPSWYSLIFLLLFAAKFLERSAFSNSSPFLISLTNSNKTFLPIMLLKLLLSRLPMTSTY